MCIPFAWHDPDLQEFHRFRFATIHFAMEDTRTGTHYLYIAHSNHPVVLLTVSVLQFSFQGDNLDIFIFSNLKRFGPIYTLMYE